MQSGMAVALMQQVGRRVAAVLDRRLRLPCRAILPPWWWRMRCFVCGEEMRVVMVEPHVIDMEGFELRTFQCVGCGDVEKRPVFDSTRPPRVPGPDATAPPQGGQGGPPMLDNNTPMLGSNTHLLGNKMKTILGSLVRLRGTPNS
jgi:hypothetical protein